MTPTKYMNKWGGELSSSLTKKNTAKAQWEFSRNIQFFKEI